jgi:hypothetical protein
MSTARATDTPTEKQYDMLLRYGSGAAGLSCGKRDTDQLLRRGWVTAEWRKSYYQWVRITPEGLHALARAVERYGLPDLGPKPMTYRRVCSDCGSTTYHHEPIAAEELIP